MDAEGDDVLMEGALSTALHSSLEFNEKEQALSSEDLAWVNSCLIPDSDMPEGCWDSLRDALLDVLSSQPITHFESSDSGAPRSPSVDLEQPVQHADEEVSGRVEKDLEKEKDKIGDNVNEFPFEEEDNLGFVLDKDETEPSVYEIFKVWELESPSEEDDFVTQLNKALKSVRPSTSDFNSTEAPYGTLPQSGDDVTFAKWKEIKDESLDNLVAGIADLSLHQFHG